jgi:hypothetical protein
MDEDPTAQPQEGSNSTNPTTNSSESLTTLQERTRKLIKEEDEAAKTPLDSSRLANPVWLVKVPAFVAEKWKTVNEPGVELGRLRVYHQQPSASSSSSAKRPNK